MPMRPRNSVLIRETVEYKNARYDQQEARHRLIKYVWVIQCTTDDVE